MNAELFKDRYRLYLVSHMQAAKVASGGKEVYCRCKYCLDSVNPTHGHMYISIPYNNEPSLFYCQKCHTSGIIDSNILMEWGIYDFIISQELNTINKNSKGNFDTVKKIFIKNIIKDKELASKKLDYINSRLGLDLSYQDAINNKIILNLKEVLDFNSCEYTRHENIIEALNNNFVGFLSYDNNFVNLRRICEEGVIYPSIDKRYINYNIFNKRDNTEKFYIIPNNIDLSLPRRVNIHLAEGVFDILSIKYNLQLQNSDNDIFIAVTGSNYYGTIVHIMNSLKMYYIHLYIYPDNDKSGSDNIVNYIKNNLSCYDIPITVRRNTFENEKDFGTCMSRIQLFQYSL